MTQPTFALVASGGLLVWIAIGLVVGFVMARRGHDPLSWMVLGVVFGPFAVPLALHQVRERTRLTETVREGLPGTGPVDVAVGIDGSPQSRAALEQACRLLGPRLGRLTLVGVLDHETGTEGLRPAQRREAAEELERLAAGVTSCRPGVVLLTGRPAVELQRYASEEGYDLLAVGTRGSGRSKALLGSVASSLAQGAPTPVLMVRADGSAATEP